MTPPGPFSEYRSRIAHLLGHMAFSVTAFALIGIVALVLARLADYFEALGIDPFIVEGMHVLERIFFILDGVFLVADLIAIGLRSIRKGH